MEFPNLQLRAVVATILIYALMTPLGSGLGTLLQKYKKQ
ncbi:unnamed protein product [Strongylus vulgaris]|uniref:Uncharacterized protein n=1 Tax=Strongylus vulgaris TaxID=40348 RepID=A0A3P7KJK4_STRVU|nr:unnamed protein product [Strongylus vulgaris]